MAQVTESAFAGRVVGSKVRLVAQERSDGLGAIWSGILEKSGCPVSVRVLAQGTEFAPGSCAAVLALARASRRARHPHLAEIVDLVCEDGSWFLVNEAAAGELLSARTAPLSASASVRLAIDLAEALSALHARGIWHGRLDPTRIVHDAHGTRVLDVGLGLLIGDDASDSRPTLRDADDPTIAFLSPEQAAGEGAPTAESDIWALGAVLHQAVAGVPPYSAKSRAALALATAKHRVSLDDGVHPKLAELILACLAREPALRPSIAEVLEAAHAIDPVTTESKIALAPGDDERAPSSSLPSATVSVITPFRSSQERTLLAVATVVAVLGMVIGLSRRHSPQVSAAAARPTVTFTVATTPEPPAPLPAAASVTASSAIPSTSSAASAASAPQKPQAVKKQRKAQDPFYGVTSPGF